MPGPQLQHAVRVSRQLRLAHPGVPIVWGGYFPSQHAEVCLRDGCVDFCVRGQGEQSFVALMRVLTRGGSWSEIPGLSWSEQGRIRETPVASLVRSTRSNVAVRARRHAPLFSSSLPG
jgi:radical SAM superfamily enzyme YgiQ (UPF0313 family)